MEIVSNLSFVASNQTVILDKRIRLLEEIKRHGSISKAAKEVPLSYKAAWEAVDTMNNLCDFPVVEKVTGGKNGGGTVVTPYGNNLIESFKELKKYQDMFFEKISSSTDFNFESIKNLKRISMELSARNQLNGKVELIEIGKVNASVYIKLKSGYTMVSVITHSAAENMNLKKGDSAVAVFKSSSVLLTKDLGLNISARNKLVGKVSKINLGEINSEILLDLGGDTIASVVTKNAAGELDIDVGDEMCAIIKASDVMIGK